MIKNIIISTDRDTYYAIITKDNIFNIEYEVIASHILHKKETNYYNSSMSNIDIDKIINNTTNKYYMLFKNNKYKINKMNKGTILKNKLCIIEP
jgi:hypothetical protein